MGHCKCQCKCSGVTSIATSGVVSAGSESVPQNTGHRYGNVNIVVHSTQDVGEIFDIVESGTIAQLKKLLRLVNTMLIMILKQWSS